MDITKKKNLNAWFSSSWHYLIVLFLLTDVKTKARNRLLSNFTEKLIIIIVIIVNSLTSSYFFGKYILYVFQAK